MPKIAITKTAFTKNQGNNAAYPFTCGNIKVLNYKWANGAAQSLTATIAQNYYGGICHLIFYPMIN